MARVAIVCSASNVVKNIIELEANANWVRPDNVVLVNCDNVSVSQGFFYSPQDNTFTAPPVEPTIEKQPIAISSLDFFDRFTDQEQIVIVAATMNNASVKLWYDKLMASKEIMLADPRLFNGLDMLVSFDLISAQRKLEILPAQTSGVTAL